MHSWKKKIFATLIVVCFSFAVFALPASAATIPASTHSASYTTTSQVSPHTSGGGCSSNYNNSLVACDSINSSRIVIGNFYAHGCFARYENYLYDAATGPVSSVTLGSGCNDAFSNTTPMVAGHTYYDCVYAWDNSWIEYSACSPYQYA